MTFTASNGMTVERDHNTDVLIGRGTDAVSVFMADGTALALREFFQHEANKRPWDDAERGDVWLFHNKDDRARALAWRGPSDWDVIDQRGHFHSGIADVPAEMRAHSFYGWDDPTAELIYRIAKEDS